MPKFLIIRFSSIGDIVLTSPVARCLKLQVENAEVHYLTKPAFGGIIRNSPYIDKVFYYDQNEREWLSQLKSENYDAVIDLHNNLRSGMVARQLDRPVFPFHKLNIEKWLLVNWKINWLPGIHIVDRYLETLSSWNVRNDGQGLDYFLSPDDKVDLSVLPEKFRDGYIAVAIGALHFTKSIPATKLVELINSSNQHFVLLGGEFDREKGDEIVSLAGERAWNAAGLFSLNESASIVEQSKAVVAGDTGLMHIAAAFKKKIFSIWGNTVPEFGMYPYLPKDQQSQSIIIENTKLSCRPCSKLGFPKCPKGHFKCMMDLDLSEVGKQLE